MIIYSHDCLVFHTCIVMYPVRNTSSRISSFIVSENLEIIMCISVTSGRHSLVHYYGNFSLSNRSLIMRLSRQVHEYKIIQKVSTLQIHMVVNH